MNLWISILASVLSGSVVSSGIASYVARRKTAAETNKASAEATKAIAEAANVIQALTDKAEEKALKQYNTAATFMKNERAQLNAQVAKLQIQNRLLMADVEFCEAEHKKYEQ